MKNSRVDAVALASGIAPALYLGRLIPELLTPSWSIPLLLGFNLALVLLAVWLKRWWRPGWPALLLLLYLLYPYPDWRVAGGVAVLVLGVAASRATQGHAGPRYLDGLVAAGLMVLYLFTLAQDVLPADNGEFQLVAATLGVAHPPGYPLHTLLGRIMTWLPFGTLPWRVNLLSALLAAGTVALVSRTVRVLTHQPWAGVAAGLALGTSTTFWSQATMSNVRTPTAFLAALALYALIRYGAAARAHGTETKRVKARWLTLFVGAFALGLSHHLSLAFIGLVFLAYLVWQDPSLIQQPRRWLRPALVALLCLLPLLYLPLRAGAPLAPSDLNTVRGFLQHTLALGFSGDFFHFKAGELLARLAVMGNVLSFQFHPLVLVGASLGFLSLVVRDGRLALLLGGGFVLHTVVTATYRAPQTVEYMLPAYVLLAVILGHGVGTLASAGGPKWAREASHVALPLLVVVSLGQGIDHGASYLALAKSEDTRRYAAPILDDAPEGAILLADWHWAMPLRYLQMVEGVRPDLAIEYVAPTAERYEETWERRIREELPLRPVVVTHYHELAYADIPARIEPLGEAYLVRPAGEMGSGHQPDGLDIILGEAVHILGASRVQDPVPLDDRITFTLAWALASDPPQNLTLFAHLVAYDGTVVAQQDTRLDTRLLELGDVATTRFQLEVRPGALPGRYSLQIGAYHSGGALLARTGAPRVEMAGLTLEPAKGARYTQHPRVHPVTGGPVLVGVDWDLTVADRPQLYLHWCGRRGAHPLSLVFSVGGRDVAGGSVPQLDRDQHQTTVHPLPSGIPLDQLNLGLKATAFQSAWGISFSRWSVPPPRESEVYVPFGSGIVYLGAGIGDSALPAFSPRLGFGASYPVQRDYVVSVSLIGLNPDDTWAWRVLDDWVPAMGAIPTLKWIARSRVNDPHWLEAPEGAGENPVIGTLIVYDAFTGRPLPILDERLVTAAPWVPLGRWEMGDELE